MEARRTLSARSATECHLYVKLHPCSCGQALEPGRHRLEARDNGLVAVYGVRCGGCGSTHQFEFIMDEEIVPLGKFGGSRPSQIIDAGEFLAVADTTAQQVGADASGLPASARGQARALMNRAIAAIEEVLKFIRPGEEGVVRDALFSTRGIAVYDKEPGRFRRSRLQAVLRSYQDAASKL